MTTNPLAVPSGVGVIALYGPALDAAVDAVAALRIGVFRDWPYLYDGVLEHERRYLQTYRDSPEAILVGAFDGARLVGASTGSPMEDHAEEFSGVLDPVGVALDRIFYCAESVLLPEYRGRGLGHRFFDLREAHARSLGRSHVAFCSVRRDGDQPMRPARHRTNDAFWMSRGYAPLPGVLGSASWTDIGAHRETPKQLQFWMREL